MPETNINITDMDLLDRLKHSYIDPDQKQELENLLPQMTNGERLKLIQLIDQADDEYRTAQVKYKEGLEKIHDEYSAKLKEEDETFRRDFETLEKKEEAEELKKFEGEIEAMPAGGQQTSQKPETKKTRKPPRKHTLRNLLLALLILATLAGGILYYLNTL